MSLLIQAALVQGSGGVYFAMRLLIMEASTPFFKMRHFLSAFGDPIHCQIQSMTSRAGYKKSLLYHVNAVLMLLSFLGIRLSALAALLLHRATVTEEYGDSIPVLRFAAHAMHSIGRL